MKTILYKIYLQNAAHGQYPYIKLKLKEKDSSKKAIAGTYDLKGTEVWAIMLIAVHKFGVCKLLCVFWFEKIKVTCNHKMLLRIKPCD